MKPKLNTRIIGVLGLGVFGRTVAKELSKYDVDVSLLTTDKPMSKTWQTMLLRRPSATLPITTS